MAHGQTRGQRQPAVTWGKDSPHPRPTGILTIKSYPIPEEKARIVTKLQPRRLETLVISIRVVKHSWDHCEALVVFLSATVSFPGKWRHADVDN